MKTIDIIITIIAAVLVGMLLQQFCGGWIAGILKLLVGAMLMITVLYWKLMPYRAKMLPQYRDLIDKADIVLGPVSKALSGLPRVQIGNGLWLDLGLAIVSLVLILILIIL